MPIAAMAASLFVGTLATTIFSGFESPASTAAEQQHGGAALLRVRSQRLPASFLDYLFFSNFETVNPSLYEAPEGCVGKYYSEWVGKYDCETITYTGGDRIEGPMHTNDAAQVEGEASFGRAGAEPPDVVEIDGGTYPEDAEERCTGKPTFNTATSCYVRGERISMPEGDGGLEVLAEGQDVLTGETRLELDGAANTIQVVNFGRDGQRSAKTLAWPANGVIYVRARSCEWPTASSDEFENADGATEAAEEKGCGNVYVRGTYSRSLTVAAEDDLIIDGDIYPTSVAGRLGSPPDGSATLGLIAGGDVRIYHPVSSQGVDGSGGCGDGNLDEAEDPNKLGSLSDPYIYAAILSTSGSFMVDNFLCGAQLGELHVYGSIAQDYRGVVGTFSGSSRSSGYAKDYKYDQRLQSDEPPYFLSPSQGQCTLTESQSALTGANGVRREPFAVRINSLGIREITFYLDGHELERLNAADARGEEYAITVDVRRLTYGAHTLSATTVMENPSCAPIARRELFVRPRPRKVIPRFTG
jgi:hypothetical protein